MGGDGSQIRWEGREGRGGGPSNNRLVLYLTHHLNIAFSIKEEVFWLEVTIDDPSTVKVLECLHHTRGAKTGNVVIKMTSKK